jgi:hypothetical protein
VLGGGGMMAPAAGMTQSRGCPDNALRAAAAFLRVSGTDAQDQGAGGGVHKAFVDG